MLSRISKSAARRSIRASRLTAQACRTFVQPSGADRARVVDVPASYQEDNHFAPRAGQGLHCYYNTGLIPTTYLDMLGFKLEAPRREGGLQDRARPIYLDMQVRFRASDPRFRRLTLFQATTPVDPRVLDAMLPFLTDQYGNPHSRTHAYGWEAEQAVEDARAVCVTKPF